MWERLLETESFLAAILGGVVAGALTLIAALVAHALERARQKHSEKERKDALDQVLARSMLIKLRDMHSDLYQLREHFTFKSARPDFLERWQVVQPMANLPRAVSFTIEELSLLLERKEFDEFHRLSELARLHLAACESAQTFNRLKLTFQERLVDASDAITLDGSVVGSSIDPQVGQKLLPKMAELESLIDGIAGMVVEGEAKSRLALIKFQKILKDQFGFPFDLQFGREGPS